MLDYLIQNFNWPTFLIALGVFSLVSSIFGLIKAQFLKAKADRRVKIAENKLAELRAQFRGKESELDMLLGKKEGK